MQALYAASSSNFGFMGIPQDAPTNHNPHTLDISFDSTGGADWLQDVNSLGYTLEQDFPLSRTTVPNENPANECMDILSIPNKCVFDTSGIPEALEEPPANNDSEQDRSLLALNKRVNELQ